jgi:methylenetetrahydrofolate--tRNA-(uracil-5-)-methyltransferase
MPDYAWVDCYIRSGHTLRDDLIHVIGGGLAGAEAAWQVAARGLRVILYEMRPGVSTPAHQTDLLAELVCSNSLGSDLVDRAPGLLKEELRRLGSLIIACADETRVPAGGALAVGREAFAQLVTERVTSHPGIELRREEVTDLPEDAITIIATGPLTSPAFAARISQLAGGDYLYFYDAMAPIVTLESIDMDRAFRSSRYDRGEADYINCPLSREEYDHFVTELASAETIALRSFEQEDPRFFEACLPVEVMARRGHKVLAFGPLKPVGLVDPRTGRRPYAVVQLRQDNLAGTLYNLVGFQTNLIWSEQSRVFRLIPGLEHAEFVRFGQMHRNTYIDSPRLLDASMRFLQSEEVFFAGQITGTEGYIGSTASGLAAGVNASRLARGKSPLILPRTTMIGALLHYATSPVVGEFQPMKPNFGLMPPLDEVVKGKRNRSSAYTARALQDLPIMSDLD